jgi:hypothetical protein
MTSCPAANPMLLLVKRVNPNSATASLTRLQCMFCHVVMGGAGEPAGCAFSTAQVANSPAVSHVSVPSWMYLTSCIVRCRPTHSNDIVRMHACPEMHLHGRRLKVSSAIRFAFVMPFTPSLHTFNRHCSTARVKPCPMLSMQAHPPPCQ